MPVEGGEHLWAIIGVVVLLSVLLYGLTVTPIMRQLDRGQGRDPDAEAIPPPGLQGSASLEATTLKRYQQTSLPYRERSLLIAMGAAAVNAITAPGLSAAVRQRCQWHTTERVWVV